MSSANASGRLQVNTGLLRNKSKDEEEGTQKTPKKPRPINPKKAHAYSVSTKKPLKKQKLKVPKAFQQFTTPQYKADKRERAQTSQGARRRQFAKLQEEKARTRLGTPGSTSSRKTARGPQNRVYKQTKNSGNDPIPGIGRTVDKAIAQEAEKNRPYTAPAAQIINTKLKLTPSERIGSLYSPMAEGLSPSKIKQSKKLVNQIKERNLEEGSARMTHHALNSPASPSKENPSEPQSPYSPGSGVQLFGNRDQLNASRPGTSSSRNIILSREFSEDEKARIVDPVNTIPNPVGKFYPLEFFDDEEEYETQTPEEWMHEAKSTNEPTAESKFLILKTSTHEWRSCYVCEYNENTKKYRIEWANNRKSTKWVTRLNLRFVSEDNDFFFERVQFAKMRREKVEAKKFYAEEIEKIDDSHVTPLPDDSVDRILSMVATEYPEVHLDTMKGSIREMYENYAYGLKKAVFDYMRSDPEFMEEIKAVRLPPQKVSPPAPALGTKIVPPYPFEQVREDLFNQLFYTKDVLSRTLTQARFQFMHYSHEPAILTELKTPISLGEFLERQQTALEEFYHKVAHDWAMKVIHIVQLNITEDIYEFYKVDNLDVYDASRMKNVIRLITTMMSSQIRKKIESNILGFVNFMHNFDLSEEDDNYHTVNGKAPLFRVSIEVRENACEFVPALDDFYYGIQEIFENAIVRCNDIPVITNRLYPLLNLPKETLSSLRTTEEFSLDKWQEINDILLENKERPNIFLDMFKKYEDVLTYDQTYFDTFKAANTEEVQVVAAQTKKKHEVVAVAEDAEDDSSSSGEDSDSDSDSAEEAAPVAASPKMQIRPTSGQREKKDPDAHLLEPGKPGTPTLKVYIQELQRLEELIQEIENLSLAEVSFDLVRVSTINIKKAYENKIHEASHSIMSNMSAIALVENKNIAEQYVNIFDTLSTEPQNAEDLASLKTYSSDIRNDMNDLLDRFSKIQRTMKTLDKYGYVVDPTEFQVYVDTFSWPKKIFDLLNELKSTIELATVKFQDGLLADVAALNKSISDYNKHLETFSEFSDLEKVEKYYEEVQEMASHIEDARAKQKLFNSRERMFKLNTSDFLLLDELENDFAESKLLWTIAFNQSQEYPEWMEGQFQVIQPDRVEENTLSWVKNLGKLERTIIAEGPRQIAETLREKLSDFKQYIPLIKALRNDGLRERHWKKISAVMGHEVTMSESLKLIDLIEMKAHDHLNDIQEISDYASKEYAIELNLERMLTEWKEIAFQIESHSGSFKITEVDDIQILLDEQIVLTQSMRASPYVKEVENDVIAWEKRLLDTQDILDEWLKCQVGWAYLEPIFSSEDIATQLPKEKATFVQVDKLWRRIMEKTSKNNIVMQVVMIANLYSDFVKANKRLDQIQKSLKDYLETKRRAFPRLYFLADDELLQILSETKDPLRVQPHLKKCFDGINRLHFTEDLVITAMMGRDGERIEFTNHVSPAEYSGKVELWLLQVQKVMQKSVRKVCVEAMKEYPKMNRTDWIAKYPGQVAIGVGQLFWTKGLEEAVQTQGLRGVQKYLKTLQKQINEIVQRVRGELTPRQRTVFSAVTTIDVHSKDVVANLVKEQVDDVDHFEWKSQLRYYWENDDMQVKQVTAVRQYGYEYLGNSGRLVITPLTDRCYRTLMGALQLSLGGAPEGPAGTGKTETVKDLAKAVATQCVVFNCSDSLDTAAMEKFFKGLASSGAWSCFDEFNRIELEVLSVIAQQILQIQRAVRAKQDRFFFEGTEIDLDRRCAVFITMNPGYAGRSELPDNLKALFRPVAMMVPDYALIAEIVLFSYGFLEGRDLAGKIVATYRLCSEQLSSQSHYDYGMRAVKAVLVRAGSLKRQYPDDSEANLMLRAISDVNAPKFLSQDIPLFDGIIKDLFPGVELDDIDYKELMNAILKMCKKRKLQPQKEFIEKIIQLYEMIIVRHGLMIVGDPFAGKTEAYRVLEGALTLMAEKGLEDKTKIAVISPKSITMGQLYGSADPQTNEWKDGILAIWFRKFSDQSPENRRWMMFDGPVDALWIESMNTVLDDNRKLCLPSGEIIKMGDNMNMIFEVQDLAVASPATVSRCGMVYMEPEKLTWEPLYKSYIEFNMPKALRGNDIAEKIINTLTYWLIPNLLEFVSRNCTEYQPTSDIMRYNSFINVFDALLDAYRDKKLVKDLKSLKAKDVSAQIEGCFLFALIWSLGGTVDVDSRPKFSTQLHELLSGSTLSDEEKKQMHKFTEPLPDKNTVYDWYFDFDRRKWQTWLSMVDKPNIPDDAMFSEIIVPTIDTTRYVYLLEKLSNRDRHVLFCGPTGTGKTAYIKGYLLNQLNDKQKPAFINFSATTTANDTQDIIESKLTKRKKGTIGAPVGKKMYLFVDDLNLPELEEYGAQPPVELLRQFCDHGGWYDRNSKQASFTNIVGITLMTAMGPPGGGRNPVTPRFIRHFNTIALTPFDDDTKVTIFTEILDWWLKAAPDLMGIGKTVVTSSIDLYNAVIQNFRPRPDKSHYTFNLRDLAKVFQGMLQMKADKLDNSKMLVRLWCHEGMRVFRDRLVNDEDRTKFNDLQFGLLKTKFKMSVNDIIPNETLIFANYMDANEDFRKYEEIPTLDKATDRLTQYLEEHNSNPKKAMPLILFKFAIEHCSRISRVITQPYGNALLIGVGGSGRQSLTRLAAYAANYNVFQIQLTKKYSVKDWKEDMRILLQQAGVKGKSTVFLFTDTQIKDQVFIEDINNLLNTGEIPNLFNSDEKKEICEQLRKPARELGKDQSSTGLFNFFVERCRQFLHIVVCMSPVGESLRTYLRMFPSLVTCCTIDWFSEWPREALASVGQSAIENIGLNEDIIPSCVDTCVHFHKSVEKLSGTYLEERKRYNYVTPTSYLELLKMLRELYNRKQEEITTLKRKYDNGLGSIADTEKLVTQMQIDLEELKPKLTKLSKENKELSEHINREKVEAEQTRKIVEREEAKISAQNEVNEKTKAECQKELDKALPALKKANKALSALQKSHITEVKSMKSPPTGVKLVMKTVCIIRGVKPVKVDQGMGKKVTDYWEPAKKMMGARGFLESLINFKIDDMNDAIVDQLKPIISQPDYNEKSVKKSNVAAAGLCVWVLSLVNVHEIMKVVRPRQEALNKALEDAKQSAKQLKETKDRMRLLQEKLDKLEADRIECVTKKKQLDDQFDDTTAKLDRAQKLIKLLAGEKTRWTQSSIDLSLKLECLVGDVLLSAGFISYLGAFTQEYRQSMVENWKNFLKENNLKYSDDYSLSNSMGKQEKIREWLVNGLPADDFSIDNAVITANSERWPLFIDPQGQASNWIKRMEEDSERGFMLIKASDNTLVRSLEKGIQMGSTVVIEKLGEDLDPALEPLLLKQIFKIGGMKSISIGDNPITYDDNFKLYLITSLSNPHYLPEVSTKVTLINFMITLQGLDDQLLGLVVRAEKAQLEQQKDELAVESVNNKNQLSKIEDEILTMLDETEDILADDSAVNMLSNAKRTADNINEQQEKAERILETIQETRDTYKPVAENGSVLFFVVAEMSNVDPMYQFSLAWYNELYCRCIEETKEGGDRIANLIDYFQHSLFTMVCRSFFEKDKLLFAFLMCIAIMKMQGKIVNEEWRFFLTGGLLVDPEKFERPNADWLTEQSFGELVNLTAIESMSDLLQDVIDQPDEWKKLYIAPNPLEIELPGKWSSVSSFQKLIITRIFRLDFSVRAISHFIVENIGERYVKPPLFNIEVSYRYASCERPLVFILSAGVDPMDTLQHFAQKELGEGAQLDTLSLGQGQGRIAAEKIARAVVRGNWVVLQNCHLSPSWMPTLETIVDTFQKGKTADTFRLWLTSMPSPDFPVSILQRSVKMTNEPPKGLKANMLSSWNNAPITNDDYFEGCDKPHEFRKLLFGLVFFHAIVQERRKFGPIGWNVQYEFNNSDLSISLQQLRYFLDEHNYVPFKTLTYLTGQCNYGGRVTDDHDRRTLMAILSDFYTEQILDDSYVFTTDGIYRPPVHGNHVSYNDYIETLPNDTGTEVFGLHDNADITKNQNEAKTLFASALVTQQRSSSGGGLSWEEIISQQASDILEKLPDLFDIEAASEKYPVRYAESMNTVLVQELLRYNKLIDVIKTTLSDVRKALSGEIVMSADLEKVSNSIFDGTIPSVWADKSYPSLKPLGGYITDLLRRIEFFDKWLQDGNPTVFWLSGFFFTQSFLTGTKQNYARRYSIAIDTIEWEFEILNYRPTEPPVDGAYVEGMFLEGASWNHESMKLNDPEPKKLYDSMPIIWLKPVKSSDIKEYPHYVCPLYKTTARHGTLSTTGHSTNYVMSIKVPTDQPEKYWVKRGTAMICTV